MAKSFIDVVQDSPRTGLGIPVKTKKTLSRTKTPPAEPPFGIKLYADSQIRPRRRKAGAGPDANSTCPAVAALYTPIELPRLHHHGDE